MLVVFAVLGGLTAFVQPTLLPEQLLPSASLPRWFLSPIVIGQALQTIDCDLRAVFASDPTHVWVTGALMFVARSDDGGATWTREAVRDPRFDVSPAQNAPAQNAPAQNAPAQDAPPQEAPSQNAPNQPPPARRNRSKMKSMLDLFEGTAHAAVPPTAPEPAQKSITPQPSSLPPTAYPSTAQGSTTGPPLPVGQGVDADLNSRPDFVAIGSWEGATRIVADDAYPYRRIDADAVWTRNEYPIMNPRDVRGFLPGAQIQGVASILEDGGGTLWISPGGLLREASEKLLNPTPFFWTPKNMLFTVSATGSIRREKVGTGGVADLSVETGGTRIRGFYFTNERQGWAVGEGGLILRTTDGGVNWPPQVSGTGATLRSAFFLEDGQHGWAVGDQGTVLGTSNGGGRWVPLTRPRIPGSRAAKDATVRPWHLPAPWYWLSLLAFGLVIRPARRPGNVVGPKVQESIANLFVTDRPVEDPRNDRLNLNALALGLSRFLRNDATSAPLTVAVTGGWGSGKSSLMKLLETDLGRFHFRPVWFNAWHYQKERHMLAGLLQAIRLQAVPDWWTREGVQFRFRLLAARSWQFWSLVAAVAFLLAMSVVFELRVHDNYSSLDRAWKAFFDAIKQAKSGQLNAALHLLGTKGSGLGLAAGLLSMFETLRRGVRAFGIDPGALLAGVSGTTKPSDLSAKTTFRQKFAAEFDTVTKALGVRKMIIFVDDLDRCRPQRVVETLEAVNFVVSSGDCFVVFGMAPERVIPCIALSFKAVAAEAGGFSAITAPGTTAAKTTSTFQQARETRALFARDYLDKLINIEIPVPAPNDEQAGALLADEGPVPPPTPPNAVAAKTPKTLATRARDAIRAIVSNKRLVSSVVLGGLVFGAVVLGVRAGLNMTAIQEPWPVITDQKDGKEAPGPNTTATLQPGSAPAPQYPGAQPAPLHRPERTGQAPVVVGDPTVVNTTPVIAIVVVLVLGFVAWILVNRRQDPVVKDSKTFKDALQMWKVLVHQRRTTPRSLKRFVNRVRYLAMNQRGETTTEDPQAPPGADAQAPAPALDRKENSIDDPSLVAVATIHELRGDDFVRSWDQQLAEALKDESVKKTWNAHIAEFKTTDAALREAARRYTLQAASVRTN